MSWSLRAALCILVGVPGAACATRTPATAPAGPGAPAIAIRVSVLPPGEPPGRHLLRRRDGAPFRGFALEIEALSRR